MAGGSSSLDLSGASWITLSAEADAGRRVVRGRTKPVLRTGPPIPGVTTVAGKPVFASPPEVLLPPGQATLRVEARRTESGAILASVTATGDAWRPDVLWRNAKRPLLGELTISVTPRTAPHRGRSRRAWASPRTRPLG